MKRILHVVKWSDWSGSTKVLYSIVTGLKQFYNNEYEIEVACGPINGLLVSELQKVGIKVHLVKSFAKQKFLPIDAIKDYINLKRIFKFNKYDIVHLHDPRPGLAIKLLSKKFCIKKVVYTVHGYWGILRHSGIMKQIYIWLQRVTADVSDKIVLLSSVDLSISQKFKIGKMKSML